MSEYFVVLIVIPKYVEIKLVVAGVIALNFANGSTTLRCVDATPS